MNKPLATIFGTALLLGGCSTLVIGRKPVGTELVGNVLRSEAANGAVTNLHFRRDGTVRAVFGKQSLTGRWQAQDGQLCFFWPRAQRECWPYKSDFERGDTRTITSDRGNRVRVTLL